MHIVAFQTANPILGTLGVVIVLLLGYDILAYREKWVHWTERFARQYNPEYASYYRAALIFAGLFLLGAGIFMIYLLMLTATITPRG